MYDPSANESLLRFGCLSGTFSPSRRQIRLTADIIEFARPYGRYGYREVAGLLSQAIWTINDNGSSGPRPHDHPGLAL